MIPIKTCSVAYNLGYFEKDREHEKRLGLGRDPVFVRLEDGEVLEEDILLEKERVYRSVGRARDGWKEYAEKSVRQNDRARAGTELIFPAPKSVSMAAMLFDDKDILRAQDEAVAVAMKEVSRHFGFWRDIYDDEGNPIGRKEFVQGAMEYESRQHTVCDSGDPHVHNHVIVYGTTYDENGELVKAQLRLKGSVKRYLEAVYQAELAYRLEGLKYRVTPTKTAFEIGFTEEERQYFSKRKNFIEGEKARYLWVKETQRYLALSQVRTYMKGNRLFVEEDSLPRAEELGGVKLGDKNEVLGVKGFSYEDVQGEYLKRTGEVKKGSGHYRSREGRLDLANIEKLWEVEKQAIGLKPPKKGRILRGKREIDDVYGIEYTSQHITHVKKEDLLAASLRRNLGRASREQIEAETLRSKSLVHLSSGEFCHINALDDELAIRDMCIEGKSKSKRMCKSLREVRRRLSDIQDEILEQGFDFTAEQWEAMARILFSDDKFIVMKGVAGSGKSTLLNYLRQIGDKKRMNFRAMCTDGKLSAELIEAISKDRVSPVDGSTIDMYLTLPDSTLGRKEILVVDEAAKVGTEKLRELMEKANRLGSRVIFIGDPERQFQGISAGNSMAILEDELGAIELTKSIRQKGSRDVERAVEMILSRSDGRVEDLLNGHLPVSHIKNEALKQSVENLNRRGTVEGVDFKMVERDLELRYYQRRSRDVMAYSMKRFEVLKERVIESGKDPLTELLVVADSNKDRMELNHRIRSVLIKDGTVGRKNHRLEGLKQLSLSEMESKNIHSYGKGQIVSFGYLDDRLKEKLATGKNYEVKRTIPSKNEIFVSDGKKTHRVSLDEVNSISVYEQTVLQAGIGEKLIFKKNHKSELGEERRNGEMFFVTGYKKGRLYYQTESERGEHKGRKFTKDDYIDLKKTNNFVDYGYALTSYASQGLTVDYTLYCTRNQGTARNHYVVASRSRLNYEIVGDSKEDYLEMVKRETSEKMIDLDQDLEIGGKKVRMNKRVIEKLRQDASKAKEKKDFVVKVGKDLSQKKDRSVSKEVMSHLIKTINSERSERVDPFDSLKLDMTMGMTSKGPSRGR